MKTWFITGVSAGFGRAIAEAALAAGDHVVGTLRDDAQCAAFTALSPGRAHGVRLDVTDEAAIIPVVEHIEHDIGPIDVLVNNAGYGHEGLIEESSLDDLRRQFDVNLFGAVAVIKAVLPFMRARRAGFIVNISSMGGIVTFPGLGFYHASKFALEGLTEALGKEVKAFGIHVTAVEPGSFRTDWSGRSMARVARTISDYDALITPILERRQTNRGHQLGDPARLGAAVVKLVNTPNPPARLLLGSDARQNVFAKLAAMRTEFEAWTETTLSTDFPS
jgi:NAD(P)-dependent dehydrogenase (short-subunit alcohol dehydrogenase family)